MLLFFPFILDIFDLICRSFYKDMSPPSATCIDSRAIFTQIYTAPHFEIGAFIGPKIRQPKLQKQEDCRTNEFDSYIDSSSESESFDSSASYSYSDDTDVIASGSGSEPKEKRMTETVATNLMTAAQSAFHPTPLAEGQNKSFNLKLKLRGR
jgi:hypothetical protein